jgi:hypothetical protein
MGTGLGGESVPGDFPTHMEFETMASEVMNNSKTGNSTHQSGSKVVKSNLSILKY